jgi:glyoxylase-like metal-dependent hydrolase (beta-lactamase superfamily II)
MTMELRQLFDPESSTYTYLLWDTISREAALIDPVQGQVMRDIRLIRELGLTLRYTLETHIHADHITGSGLLRRTLNSIVLVHENCGSKCADILLKDGDRIPLGSGKIDVIHTPGHTSCDISYSIPGIVFTGDALLIRGCGRTDFQSGDAGTLYDSITEQLFILPGDTIIYPGHDYNGRSYSSIAEEIAYNPRIGNGRTREEFISIMDSLQLAPPQRIHEALPSNLRCGLSENENANLAAYT